MNLSPAYLKWETETLQQGRQEGLQNGRQEGLLEGQRVLVENLLKSRFGVLDDALTQIIEPLLRLPPDKMSPLLLQSNRGELLAKFKPK
jgi:flagellar biosynthesis/type III secretory pathway protein FliH